MIHESCLNQHESMLFSGFTRRKYNVTLNGKAINENQGDGMEARYSLKPNAWDNVVHL